MEKTKASSKYELTTIVAQLKKYKEGIKKTEETIKEN
jgi:hypothetical protein